MTLTLRAVSLNDLPLTQPITAYFDGQGGTIGRADHNTMALPDPERHISRQQAKISAAGAGYVIKNVGSANPILLRNLALAQGESAPLAHCDRVRIGGYLLEVIDDAADDNTAAAADATSITRGRAAIDAQNATRLLPKAVAVGAPQATTEPAPAIAPAALDGWGPLSRDNPFAGLLADAQPTRAAMPPTPSRDNDDEPVARLPTNFDPFAPRPEPPARAAAAPAHEAGSFDDLLPHEAANSIDELIGADLAGSLDPLADFMADAQPPARHAAAGSTEATAPDHVPELRAAFRPPKPLPAEPVDTVPPPSAAPAHAADARVALPEPPVRPQSVAPEAAPAPDPAHRRAGPHAEGRAGALDTAAAAGHAGANTTAAWAAFCEGAGIDAGAQPNLDPEWMRVVGGLLRGAVEGTLQLMALRATTRYELHAQVTTIRPRENNPLKFSPDARSALEKLLQPPSRGFLPAPAAMTDAMNDLVGHAIGTMAGTRAALEGVLGRFAPKELEAKLVGTSVLDSLLPITRKARLWELYLQHHDAIRNEAQDDFHALFGKAFLAAYEQQLERLRRNQPPATA